MQIQTMQCHLTPPKMTKSAKMGRCMQHRHPLWVPVQGLAALLPIQLPPNALGKAVEDGTSAWSSAPSWETQKKL